MAALTQYDDLYVISDLHLGGKPGFQIMNRGERLGAFIRQLAVRPDGDSGRHVGLVINGDVFDTLAEEFDGYIAVSAAEAILNRLDADPAFEPVWSALSLFVRRTRRRLVFTIGNHDIELALPAVQQSLRRRLAGDDEAASGRIEFAVDGAGYSCHVGDVRIFCTHGNELDAWNVVDHDALRRVVRDQNAGVAFDRAGWTPNAGTRLVRDVMNLVKRRRPWVDLLKPERKVVLGVLLTIEPAVVRHLPAMAPVAWNHAAGQLRTRGLLSADDPTMAAPSSAQSRAEWGDVVGKRLHEMVAGPAGVATVGQLSAGADAMLLDVERQLADGVTPRNALQDLEGTLGWPRMLFDRLHAVDRVEALRRALLDWCDDDRSFDLTNQDETYRHTVRHVGDDIDVIVTGHTHLERAIVSRARAYYNTGTWIRLIRLPDAMLEGASQFARVFRLLEEATLAQLDDARITSVDGTETRLVLDRTTALRMTAGSDGVAACLGHVVDDADDGARFVAIEGSEFRRA